MISKEHLHIEDIGRTFTHWILKERLNIGDFRKTFHNDDIRRTTKPWWYQKNIDTLMIPEEHLHIEDTRITFTDRWYQKNIHT